LSATLGCLHQIVSRSWPAAAPNTCPVSFPPRRNFPSLSLNLWCKAFPGHHVSFAHQDQQRFETSSLPTLTRSYPRHFTFYVAESLGSIRMSPLLIKISKDFATIWTTIDPIGNVAIFAGLTAALTRAERHRTALRASIYATVILVATMTVGQIILDLIGIHLHSLKVAGGIILFLFAIKMLFGQMDSKPGPAEPGRDLAVFPLAVPSIAGPGAMMAILVLTDDDVYTVPERIQTGVVLLVVLLLTYILLLFSDAILRIIGRSGAAVLVRVMGIILASLAVEIVLTTLGVAQWAPVPR